MNHTLRKSSNSGSHMYARAPRLSLKKQRTYVVNPTLLTPKQSKICASNISYFVPCCANECVKEKEKNTTFFTKCHGDLLTTRSNYLSNNMLVY